MKKEIIKEITDSVMGLNKERLASEVAKSVLRLELYCIEWGSGDDQYFWRSLNKKFQVSTKEWHPYKDRNQSRKVLDKVADSVSVETMGEAIREWKRVASESEVGPENTWWISLTPMQELQIGLIAHILQEYKLNPNAYEKAHGVVVKTL